MKYCCVFGCENLDGAATGVDGARGISFIGMLYNIFRIISGLRFSYLHTSLSFDQGEPVSQMKQNIIWTFQEVQH